MTASFVFLLTVSCYVPSVIARCTGSNCRSSLSTGAKIGIGVGIAVLALSLLACAMIRQCIIRRRIRQQQPGYSIAPPPPAATATSAFDGAGAAGMVGDGRYPQPYYSNNAMNGHGGNMTQAYPNGLGPRPGVGQGVGRVPAPPPSYKTGTGMNIDGNPSQQYDGHMAGVGGFKPPSGPPPNVNADQRV